MFCENYEAFVEELKKRKFTPHSARDGKEALSIALSLIEADAVVGCGGSMTVQGIGLPAALRARGNTVHFHWDVPWEERATVFPKAAAADWYVCSVNGITRKAKLINIDGSGNRISGTFFGPQRVLFIIGKNKFAEDMDSAMDRVKRVACANNARRFGFQTPCALTDTCTDCYSPQRICKVTTIIEHLPGLVKEMHLILVDEDLGY